MTPLFVRGAIRFASDPATLSRLVFWLESGTVSLKTNFVTQPLGERPLVLLEPTEHPLSLEQQHGIDMARVQAIIESALHAA